MRSPLLMFALAGAGTYLLRVSMVLGGGRLPATDWIERRVTMVVPAVLAALLVSALFVSNGERQVADPVEIGAVAAALFAVSRTGNINAALAVGLPIYWIAALGGLT